MIKEKKKKDRFGAQKTKRQILLEYGRTAFNSCKKRNDKEFV